MTEIRPDLIQEALIDYAKASTTITDELDDTDEIREHQWQGREFSYPNIRLRMSRILSVSDDDCNRYTLDISWMVFSEEASSWQANRIAGIISSVLHSKSFSQNGLLISLQTSSIIPAIRSDARTWRSEVLQRGTVSG